MGTFSPPACSFGSVSDAGFRFPGVQGYPSNWGSISWRGFDGVRPDNIFLDEVDAVIAERLLAQACHEII